MGRGRIPMELIQKEKARKTTFLKRKNGLMKKVYEFSTLCGVDVCVIIYGPNFDNQQLVEPETWPQDRREVYRIIQKYYDTTSDRRPKIYGVQEYYQDRMKKVEGEISKICKDKLKIIYPTWDDSFNPLGEEQLRIFVSLLDSKLDACSQRMNMLKGDHKGKAIAESDNMIMTLSPYLASNPSSYLNLMQNIAQAQFFPPLSQPSMLHFGQNYMQLMGKNGMVMDWADQVGNDNKNGMLKEDGDENNQKLSPNYYYNGNIQTMQPCSIDLQTLPSQNSQYEVALTDPPPGFQLNGLYGTNMVQSQMFNYMQGRE
ncbi:hypothetical protein SESBI_27771 [Sesbania bispinosa]|nr:hypothetical protein SESBI_27771 [Sesbania bispinosa]